MRLCKFPGCTRPHRSSGLCDGHYRQAYRGAPLAPLKKIHDRSFSLEAAAERYAKASTARELTEARVVLQRAARAYAIRSLLALAREDQPPSRRAVPPAHPSPAQGPEGVIAAVPGPSSAERAA